MACYEKHGDESVVSKSAIKIWNPNIWTNCSDEMHKILSRLLVKSVLRVLNSDAMFLKCFHHLITRTKCFEYLNSFLALMEIILAAMRLYEDKHYVEKIEWGQLSLGGSFRDYKRVLDKSFNAYYDLKAKRILEKPIFKNKDFFEHQQGVYLLKTV